MINYTIIIPHKNTPDLLQRCINSIPIRDDLQIIIIDDNSDPTIVDFNNFPGNNRQNTKIIFNKDGLGAGNARNKGLEAITNTKWVIFSDADDFFTPYLSDALDKYENDEADMIYFKLESVNSDSLEPVNRSIRINKRTDLAIAQKNYDLIRYKAIEPYCKFIKFKNIEDIRFETVMYSNDVMFGLMIGYKSRKIKIDPNSLYIVTERQNSLVKIVKEESIRCRYDVAIRGNNFLKKIRKEKYHTNLFAYCYKFNKINMFIAIKYFFKSLYYTQPKYWYNDILLCIRELFK